jgi:competence protein ComEA
MKRRTDKIPGANLLTILLAIWICWMAAVRIGRPIVRQAGDRPPAVAVELTAGWPDMRIDINSASAAELALLPGIGPRLSERIVDDRAARGPYGTLEELTRVNRIGPTIVQRIRPYVVVEPPDESP